MKRLWAGLSPWLDIPMNQRHWKLLCVFAIASTPLGFGLGQLARRRYERLEAPAPERRTERERESNRQTVAERNREAETQRDTGTVSAPAEALLSGRPAGMVIRRGDTGEKSGRRLAGSEVAAIVMVPAGLGWVASMVFFPPRS